MQPDQQAFMAAVIAAGLSTLVLTVILQIPRVSRIWLGWLPGVLRKPLCWYFGPRPALHPGIPDPALFAAAPNAKPHEKAAAYAAQICLSAIHGIHDFGHYFARFVIALITALVVVSAVLFTAIEIARLCGYTL